MAWAVSASSVWVTVVARVIYTGGSVRAGFARESTASLLLVALANFAAVVADLEAALAP